MTCRIEHIPYRFHDLAEAFTFLTFLSCQALFRYDGCKVYLDGCPVMILRVYFLVHSMSYLLTYKTVATSHSFSPEKETELSLEELGDIAKEFDVV